MSQAKQDALGKLTSLLMAGAGVGVAGRSLLGLKNLLAPAEPTNPLAFTSPISTPLPIQVGDEEEARRQKRAGEPVPPATTPTLKAQIADAVIPNINAKDTLMHGWGMPAAAATLGTGVGGGWALTDWLLRRRQQNQAKDETQDAEQDYQHALADQYRAAMRGKAAADDLGIDALFDAMTKLAELGTAAFSYPQRTVIGNENWEKLKGVIGTAAVVAGAGTAYASYKATRDRSQKAITEQALRLRARQRQMGTPIPFTATPTPLEA